MPWRNAANCQRISHCLESDNATVNRSFLYLLTLCHKVTTFTKAGCCSQSLFTVVTCWSLIIPITLRCRFSCECPVNIPVASLSFCRGNLSSSLVLPLLCPCIINLACQHVLIFCQRLFACTHAHCLIAVLTALWETRGVHKCTTIVYFAFKAAHKRTNTQPSHHDLIKLPIQSSRLIFGDEKSWGSLISGQYFQWVTWKNGSDLILRPNELPYW